MCSLLPPTNTRTQTLSLLKTHRSSGSGQSLNDEQKKKPLNNTVTEWMDSINFFLWVRMSVELKYQFILKS